MLEDVWIFGTVRESITTSPPDHGCRFAADNDDTTIRRHDGAFGAGTKCHKEHESQRRSWNLFDGLLPVDGTALRAVAGVSGSPDASHA
jgi:hypothetical protein